MSVKHTLTFKHALSRVSLHLDKYSCFTQDCRNKKKKLYINTQMLDDSNNTFKLLMDTI